MHEEDKKFGRLEAMINQLVQEIRIRPLRRPRDRRQSHTGSGRQSPPCPPKCWTCNRPGHLARDYQEKATKERAERNAEQDREE